MYVYIYIYTIYKLYYYIYTHIYIYIFINYIYIYIYRTISILQIIEIISEYYVIFYFLFPPEIQLTSANKMHQTNHKKICSVFKIPSIIGTCNDFMTNGQHRFSLFALN